MSRKRRIDKSGRNTTAPAAVMQTPAPPPVIKRGSFVLLDKTMCPLCSCPITDLSNTRRPSINGEQVLVHYVCPRKVEVGQ